MIARLALPCLLLVPACSGGAGTTPDGGDGGLSDAGSGGGLVWAVQAGGPAYDFAAGIAATADGSACVAGAFQEWITFGAGEAGETRLTSAGDWDACLARYHPDGRLDWALRIGGPRYERAWSVSAAGDGTVLVTGAFQETIVLGEGEDHETRLTSEGNSDAFVARYDPRGRLVWARGVGGAGSLWGRAVAASSDGGCVVAGWLTQTATFGSGEPSGTSLTSAGGGDAFLARYAPDGRFQWARQIAGPEEIEARAVSIRDDGSFAILGRFRAAATFGPGEPRETRLTSAGEFDVFVAEYLADGTLGWAGRIGGASHVEPGGVAALPGGALLVAGSFQEHLELGAGTSNHLEFLAAAGWDLFLARFDRDGTPSWECRSAVEVPSTPT